MQRHMFLPCHKAQQQDCPYAMAIVMIQHCQLSGHYHKACGQMAAGTCRQQAMLIEALPVQAVAASKFRYQSELVTSTESQYWKK